MVSVTDLKDFLLCPVIPWIRKKLNWKEPETDGLRIGKKIKEKEIVSSFPNPKYFQVFLRDKSSGLQGIVDVLTSDSVVEIKAFPRKYFNHFRVQLLSYAFLADKNGFRIKRAILFMGKEMKLNIEVEKEHIEYVEKITEKINEVLDNDSPPTANPPPLLCKSCQYRKVCPIAAIT
ncbi:CRISPR-associated protein Cas4 [Sulfurisphaera javensis]|uniref:CRISPR-associated exonuclease Cas4 n=1 Tax=Sulfurisphaera javensis TaxID=2049879 RepID=A0AAT9GUU7_9CREN